MAPAADPKKPRKGSLPDLSILPSAERWAPCRDCEAQERGFDLGDVLIVHQVWYCNGQLTDFFIGINVVDDEGVWHEALRIDACHGEVHVHRFDRDGEQQVRKVLVEVHSQADLANGHGQAIVEITDRLDDNIRRWKSGR